MVNTRNNGPLSQKLLPFPSLVPLLPLTNLFTFMYMCVYTCMYAYKHVYTHNMWGKFRVICQT
jgi:hypothetical protein